MFLYSLLVAVSVIIIGGCIAIFRKPNLVKSTQEGAKEALVHIQEWAKWLSGLQTAVIAGLGWLVLDSNKCPLQLNNYQQFFALAAFVCLGTALFCSAWILASIPSMTLRIYGLKKSEPSTEFDIYEQPLFGFEKSVKLGYMLSLNHWYWGGGLFFAGLLIITRFALVN